MKKRTVVILVLVICLLAAVPAMAADVFKFAEQTATVYADETIQPALVQDGRYAEGELVFSSANAKVFTVDEAGTVTGVAPGTANLVVQLQQNGKAVRKASMRITVARRVTKITLNTTNLQVFEPDDETILPLLKQDPEAEPLTDRILILAAGKSIRTSAAITPADVKNKKYTVTSSDLGIVKVTGVTLKAVQPGECELTIASDQNPEVTEKFHVLVTQPVKKLQITAPAKNVSAGGTLQLSTAATPSNATIQAVTWSSRNVKKATVDANGLVTGIERGNVIIEAQAADGSGVRAQITLAVTQDVTQITIEQTDVTVATKRRSPLVKATALPTNASNRKVTWSSSDETIATVQNGYVTGVKAGECYITCTSVSNPGVSASIPVHVVQLATRINVLNPKGLSFNVGETAQLEWEVLPDDTTNKSVTFSSRAPKIAAVDANGIVTGLSRGAANIEVKAADGSNMRTVFQVNVIQPVTGIEPLPDHYFAQLDDYRRVSNATRVIPRNANNQRIYWSTSDPSIASVKNGEVYGHRIGNVTLTATSEDGGFSTSTELFVRDFDRMIVNQPAQITDDNKIKLSFGNMSPEFIIEKIYFKVECFDTMGNPMVCNTDGVSTFFEGNYPRELYPSEWTEHGQFNFNHYQDNGWLGFVIVTVTGFEFDNGQRWTIPEEKQEEYAIRSSNSSRYGQPTPTPEQTFAPPAATPAPDTSGNG